MTAWRETRAYLYPRSRVEMTCKWFDPWYNLPIFHLPVCRANLLPCIVYRRLWKLCHTVFHSKKVRFIAGIVIQELIVQQANLIVTVLGKQLSWTHFLFGSFIPFHQQIRNSNVSRPDTWLTSLPPNGTSQKNLPEPVNPIKCLDYEHLDHNRDTFIFSSANWGAAYAFNRLF